VSLLLQRRPLSYSDASRCSEELSSMSEAVQSLYCVLKDKHGCV
jgi:hypothetical protein